MSVGCAMQCSRSNSSLRACWSWVKARSVAAAAAAQPGVRHGHGRSLPAGLRARTQADVACEPRHPSWFTADVDALLSAHGVARVAADPARVPAAAVPGGDRAWSYWRWHGQPQIYRSAYSEQALAELAQGLRREADAQRPAWFVLDNTALGHATGNAPRLQALLQENAHA